MPDTDDLTTTPADDLEPAPEVGAGQQPALFADPHAEARGYNGAIEAAAARTIKALAEHGGLDATHALKVELILQGSRALDRELRREKVTVAAIGLFTRVTEIAEKLPTVQAVVADQWEQITAALAEPSADAPSAERRA